MTEGVRQELTAEQLAYLIGYQVTDARVGIGTFLILDLADTVSRRLASLWVYLADWALLADDFEVMASDSLPTNREARLPVDALIGRHFSGATHLDGEEMHLQFSDDVRLEVWENREAYGVGAEFLQIFRDGAHVTTLTFTPPPIH